MVDSSLLFPAICWENLPPPPNSTPPQKNTQNTENIKKCIKFPPPPDMCSPPRTWSLEFTLSIHCCGSTIPRIVGKCQTPCLLLLFFFFLLLLLLLLPSSSTSFALLFLLPSSSFPPYPPPPLPPPILLHLPFSFSTKWRQCEIGTKFWSIKQLS